MKRLIIVASTLLICWGISSNQLAFAETDENLGQRMRSEINFSQEVESAINEMGWTNTRIAKYGDLSCGLIKTSGTNSLSKVYRNYFGESDPNDWPQLKSALTQIYNWAKNQPECQSGQ